MNHPGLRPPCASAAGWALLALLLGGVGQAARADFLYVSNFNTDSVIRIDLTTRTVDRTYTGIGVNGPQGLAVSSDGSTLYVASSFRANQAANPTAIVRFDVDSGAETGSVALTGSSRDFEGLSLSSDNSQLYATHRGPNGTTTGGALYRINTSSFNALTALDVAINRPDGLAIAPDDGSLFMALGNDTVIRRNLGTGSRVLATYSSPLLNVPSGVFLGDGGTSLYVANTFNNNVVKFNVATASVSGIYTLPTPAGNFIGITGGATGPLYVVDAFNNRILNLDTATGQSSEFTFTGAALNSPTFALYVPSAVPEPASLGLFALGGLGALAWGRRLRRRPSLPA